MSKYLSDDFWVTNISDRNVCLSDLALTIPAKSSMNLLDSRNFSLTYSQLEASATEGSLFKKRDKIKLGITHRQIESNSKIELSTQPIQTRRRSAVVIKEPEYKDWLFSDEEFANEMSEEPEE
jgi:hypothetical protein